MHSLDGSLCNSICLTGRPVRAPVCLPDCWPAVASIPDSTSSPRGFAQNSGGGQVSLRHRLAGVDGQYAKQVFQAPAGRRSQVNLPQSADRLPARPSDRSLGQKAACCFLNTLLQLKVCVCMCVCAVCRLKRTLLC